MENVGNKVYLTIEEQKDNGYPSPIDLDTFPLHEEREAVDSELDRLQAMVGADDDELTHSQRASLPADLERTRRKSSFLRDLGKISATRSIVFGS